MLIDFQSFLTVGLNSVTVNDITSQLIVNDPVKYVATLPCETFTRQNRQVSETVSETKLICKRLSYSKHGNSLRARI